MKDELRYCVPIDTGNTGSKYRYRRPPGFESNVAIDELLAKILKLKGRSDGVEAALKLCLRYIDDSKVTEAALSLVEALCRE